MSTMVAACVVCLFLGLFSVAGIPVFAGVLVFMHALATGPVTNAAERLKVIVPPEGQEAAEELSHSLAEACNSGDFIGFIDHFTPAHGRRVRGRMEDVFIKYQPRMEIHQVVLLSEDEDRLTFGVKYSLHDDAKSQGVLASKVTARRVAGKWKLDSENVKSVNRIAHRSKFDADESGGNAMNADWNPFAPPDHLIDPDLVSLKGDIGIRAGRGCANGRCNP